MSGEEIWLHLVGAGWHIQVSGGKEKDELIFIATAFKKAQNKTAAAKLRERTSQISATSYSWDSALAILELKVNEQ